MQNSFSTDQALWVFGYGSLIWNPGFEYEEKVQARLFGYHRALCIYSHVHRGTVEKPGLVLGLDRGGSCRGIAYRVKSGKQDETLAYLRARELVTNVYHEANVELRFESGEKPTAVTYVVDRQHIQYSGRLPLERQLELIKQGKGQSGINADYVISTAEHLKQLNIRDHTLEWLHRHLT